MSFLPQYEEQIDRVESVWEVLVVLFELVLEVNDPWDYPHVRYWLVEKSIFYSDEISSR